MKKLIGVLFFFGTFMLFSVTVEAQTSESAERRTQVETAYKASPTDGYMFRIATSTSMMGAFEGSAEAVKMFSTYTKSGQTTFTVILKPGFGMADLNGLLAQAGQSNVRIVRGR